MRLALAQINTVVGDLDGNAERIGRRLAEAKEQQADLVVFRELAITGYPPEDLLLRPSFVQAAQAKAEALAREARGIVALIGVPWFDRDLYNACAVCAAGEIKTIYRRRCPPNYCVLDKDRSCATGRDLVLLEHGATLGGPTICEDMWQPGPPATDLALAGAQLLVNLSASPFHLLRDREREEMFATRARDNSCFVAFCNSVGGQDELLFDGNSLVLDEEGHLLARGPSFEEALLVVDIEPAAALAVEALGPRRVHCVSMPSRYSSAETRDDARRLAANLGADFRELLIDAIYNAFEAVLAESFAGREHDLTEENLQARIRGVLLMGLSNKFGWLVVATGNKSELSVGYATLYGDLAGGFALIKDVFKTDVFRLARHMNERAGEDLIPETIIERAPSAELRDNQLDEDSLPPYPALDKVLAAYVEEDRSAEELSADGFDPDVVERAVAMIDRAEYKRRQAPPGVRLRQKAFGRDRRTPITNRWRG